MQIVTNYFTLGIIDQHPCPAAGNTELTEDDQGKRLIQEIRQQIDLFGDRLKIVYLPNYNRITSYNVCYTKLLRVADFRRGYGFLSLNGIRHNRV